jgi:7-cyano-7-deazaguanine synthase
MHVVLFSGGMDSTMALLHALWEMEQNKLRCEVVALTFRYGQIHEIELAAARRVAKAMQVPHFVIDLGDALYVPAEPGAVVPGRNLMFLTAAASWIEQSRTWSRSTLWLGVSHEDHLDFPDCRLAFLDSAEECLGDAGLDVCIEAPFAEMSKHEAIEATLPKWPFVRDKRGLNDWPGGFFGFLEAETYSCYLGGFVHCGKCAACIKRGDALDCDGE